MEQQQQQAKFDFSGKTVVVTGAGGNFGRFGATFFARCGANVALLDVVEGPLAEALQEAQEAATGGKCIAVTCDISKEDAVAAAVDKVEAELGDIHHLWNNAGYQGEMKPTPEYSVPDFRRVMDINVVGSFAVLQAVARKMIKSETKGSIVNTASVAALRGTPTMCAYVASKSAIIGLTVSTAKDLAPYHIRVNAVSPALIGPGTMWTRQNELHASSGSPYFSRVADEVGASKIASVPLKRLGSIEEVVQSVAFLLSDASLYTTGHNLVISGGLA